MNKKAGVPSVWLLGAASALSPFGVTMAVPLLASIATRFNADFGLVQFVTSAYLLGLAVAQPFNGFLCDRFGRRPVMLTGFAVFVLASTALAFATSINDLIAFRFIQALGVSVGTVASRAIVRDSRGSAGATEALSYIAAFMGLAPIIAPVLGGWLGAVGGYPAVFLSTALMGGFIWALMFFRLPETLGSSREKLGWGDWMHRYRILFTSPVFLAYSVIFGFAKGSFFAFLAVGAAVFEADFGMDVREFGMTWGLMATTYVAGAFASGRLSRRLGSRSVMNIAVLITLLAGWTLTLLVMVIGMNLFGLLLPLAVLMAAAGGISPISLAGAVNQHPEMAGTSSGLSSAIGIVFGGFFTVLAGLVYAGDFTPVAWLVAASTSLTAISWLWVRSQSRA